MNNKTILSEDRIYRYTLWRKISEGGRYINFICLNPSTADEKINDATIRKCIGFTKLLGFDSFCMTNLFAYRDVSPKNMKQYYNPIGEENDKYIKEIAKNSSLIICGWGNHGSFMDRGNVLIYKLKLLGLNPMCFDKNKDGSPKHPLYVKYNTELKEL